MQEKLEQVSDFNEWYPVGWIGDICYLYNNEVAFLNFRNSIVDLESHEVMFVDNGSVDYTYGKVIVGRIMYTHHIGFFPFSE